MGWGTNRVQPHLGRYGWLDLSYHRIMGFWRHRLGDESLSPIPNNGWDYALKDSKDLALVFQCSEFTPIYTIQHHLSPPISEKNATMTPTPDAFSAWEKPTGDVTGFYHLIKSFIPLDVKEKRKLPPSMTKRPMLGWDPDRWRWACVYSFLITPQGWTELKSLTCSLTQLGKKQVAHLPP